MQQTLEDFLPSPSLSTTPSAHRTDGPLDARTPRRRRIAGCDRTSGVGSCGGCSCEGVDVSVCVRLAAGAEVVCCWRDWRDAMFVMVFFFICCCFYCSCLGVVLFVVFYFGLFLLRVLFSDDCCFSRIPPPFFLFPDPKRAKEVLSF